MQAGADEVIKLFNELDDVTIGPERYPILDKELTLTEHSFAVTDSLQRYHFVTPWLALNSANYLKFKAADWTMRKQLLSRVLVGNVLSAAKGLDIQIAQKLVGEIKYVKPVICSIKGSPLLGFYGCFTINFDMPALFSIGKSVSRGFGVILKG